MLSVHAHSRQSHIAIAQKAGDTARSPEALPDGSWSWLQILALNPLSFDPDAITLKKGNRSSLVLRSIYVSHGLCYLVLNVFIKKMQGRSCGGIVQPAGRVFTPGGSGFCENTFLEPIDDASATAKHTITVAAKTRVFMPYSCPVKLFFLFL